MRHGFEGLMVGRTLAGRYEVLDALARGGMSVLFRGLDRTLGREVAVKVVSLAGASDTQLPVFRERFRREAASAARIQHPNVVQVFDYGTDPELELDFIVMELLRGRDLKEALREGPLDAADAVRILGDAARGVAAGHRAGILHRDVKPANVFLLGDGGEVEVVKILDFGIAKPMEDDPELHALTTIGNLPHSPAYASPEQVSLREPVTTASDVYQLGLIGYEMLAGRRPYDQDERARVQSGEAVPLPETDAWGAAPPHVRAVVARALSLRAKDRFPDAAAFAEALSEARAQDATTFHPPPVSAPVPDPDATELVSATAGLPIVAPPAPELPPASSPRGMDGIRAVPPPSARRMVIPRTPVLWIVPLLLLLGVALWAGRHGDGGGPRIASSPPGDTMGPDSARMEVLDREFVRLQGLVARGAARHSTPFPSGSVPESRMPPRSTPSTLRPGTVAANDVLARAQAEIEAAVHDLNKAWVEGDITRHVSHYASRVDYYNSNNLPRSGVRRDRTRDMRRYDDRRIGIHAIEVRWLEPDRAQVLVDKEWIYGEAEGRTRQGRGMQEYIFKRDQDDGRWYVISEQLLTTTEARSPAGS